MNMITYAVVNDWPVLLPIILSSILTVAVAVERWLFYRRNRRDVVQFINLLDHDLQNNQLQQAVQICTQTGGLLGEVAEEGIRTLARQRFAFERLFDITVNLATRKLERNLSILGTIATVAPYLGLFGTVVRILLTFGDMAKGTGGAGTQAQVMSGIGSALIATAFGLGVAIVAVVLNNRFHALVSLWEEDFQLLKLLFLSVADRRATSASPQQPQQQYAQAPSQAQPQQQQYRTRPNEI